MAATTWTSRVGNRMRILLLVFLSDLTISQTDVTLLRSEPRNSASTQLASTMDTIFVTDKNTEILTDTLELTTINQVEALLESATSPPIGISTDVTDIKSPSKESSTSVIVTEIGKSMSTSIQDNQQFGSSTTYPTNIDISSYWTTLMEATDGDSREEFLDAESVGTSPIFTAGQELTTQILSDEGMSSPLLSTSQGLESSSSALSTSSTSSLNTNQEATTIFPDSTWNQVSVRAIPGPPRVNRSVTVRMSLEEDCEKFLNKKNDFLKAVEDHMVKEIRYMKREHIKMVDAKCGSVIVMMNLLLPESELATFNDRMRGLEFLYRNVTLGVIDVRIEGEPTISPTTVDDVRTMGPADNFQQTLIFIVIGSVGGAFLLLSFFLLCQYLTQKIIRACKKSYKPSDEPTIKLADFNMAHTYIPRPQSIYSATTRSSFLPYESMDHGYRLSSASPTPYVYADGDQIREHYQEVVEKDPVTPTSKTVNDFGRSGIPSWDLPVLEGVVHEGTNGSTLRIDDRKPTTSSTFHAPPSDIPPPPTTSPPPPPSSVESAQRAAEGASLKSDDGSSHTEQSAGDTRHLIRGQQCHSVGIDNPAADVDNAYF